MSLSEGRGSSTPPTVEPVHRPHIHFRLLFMDSIASSALLQVFSDESRDSTPRLPASSSTLLRHLILHGAELKLRDRADFDVALRILARSWEHGTLTLRDEESSTGPGSSMSAGEAVVTSVTLASVKKRKRNGEDVSGKLRDCHPRSSSVLRDMSFRASLSQAQCLPIPACECRARRSV